MVDRRCHLADHTRRVDGTILCEHHRGPASPGECHRIVWLVHLLHPSPQSIGCKWNINMKRTFTILFICGTLLLTSCGSSSSNAPQPIGTLKSVPAEYAGKTNPLDASAATDGANCFPHKLRGLPWTTRPR